MFRRRKPEWAKLASGLYVPPYLEFAPWYPCPDCCDGSPTCECTYCQGDLGPQQFQVEFPAGTLINTGQCTDCDAQNTTFVLECNPSQCTWAYTYVAPVPCTDTEPFDYVTLDILFTGGEYLVDVAIGWTSAVVVIEWTKNYGGTKPDCRNFSNEAIPYNGRNLTVCTSNEADILVTAL